MTTSELSVVERTERLFRAVGLAAGAMVLGLAVYRGVWQGLRRPGGRATGNARRVLRPWPMVLLAVAWTGLCALLWRPLPLRLRGPARAAALAAGSAGYFGGLGLYLWGAQTLGRQFRPSTALGVELVAGHQLVTRGPFAWVRHPMYLGLQLVGLGGLLLYRNWTFAFIAGGFLPLFLRARREEEALAAEFGAAWQAYAARVPFWRPRLSR